MRVLNLIMSFARFAWRESEQEGKQCGQGKPAQIGS